MHYASRGPIQKNSEESALVLYVIFVKSVRYSATLNSVLPTSAFSSVALLMVKSLSSAFLKAEPVYSVGSGS